MEIGIVISFLFASILLTLMPGPDNILVLTESITNGRKNGVALSLGLGSGVLVHTLVAATGLSLILVQSEFIFASIKYAGAAYLFYLAYLEYKNRNTKISAQASLNKQTFGQLYFKGITMNVLNPKVTLFFIAFLPQFISPNGFAIGFQMGVLGVLFMLQAMLLFSIIALLAGSLNTLITNSRFWAFMNNAKIIILFGLGCALIFVS